MMPWSSLFGSSVFDVGEENQPIVGERQHRHKWLGGLSPNPVSVGGICGTKEQWEQGSVSSDPILSKWPDQNVPVCCPRPPDGFNGGIGIGGSMSPSASSGVTDCVECPVAPTQWIATMSGWEAGGQGVCCLNMNGLEKVLNHLFPCEWGTLAFSCGCTDSPSWYILFDGTAWKFYVVSAGDTIYATLPLVGEFDCLGPNRFEGVGTSPGCNGTLVALIKPA